MLTRIQIIMRKTDIYPDKKSIAATIAASVYLSIVLYLTFISTWKLLWCIPIATVFVFMGLTYGLDYIKSFSTPAEIESESLPNKDKGLWWQLFGILFCGQMLYFLAYFPGGFNLDALSQWDQAHGIERLSNWHPVLTTLWYGLLSHMIDHPAFCVFVQLLLFSLVTAALLNSLFKTGVTRRLVIAIAILIAINPAIGTTNVCLVKDVLFSIAVIWTVNSLLAIYTSEGRWMQRPSHLCLLILQLILITQIRHNGIFFVIPLLLLLMLCYRRELLRILVLTGIFCLVTAAIEGPVMKLAGVEQHANITGESVGIPMSVMANAFVNDYEDCPEDVKEFLYSLSDFDVWEDHYIVGEWDSCKWVLGDGGLFADKSLAEFIPLTVETVISCPETTYCAIRENTRVVWQAVGKPLWITYIYIEENTYGIEENRVAFLEEIAEKLVNFSSLLPVASFVWNTGMAIALLIVGLLAAFVNVEHKKVIFVVPLLAYDILTMCLLCGPSYRYFYLNGILLMPLLAILFYHPAEKKQIL